MHAPPHLLFDRSQLRPHAIAPVLPLELEGTLAEFAADEGEAQEAKALRFAKPTLSAPVRRKATELDQSSLVRMKRQRESPNRSRLEPFSDQADDARVADPVLNEADEPIMAHRIEERLDISVQYEVHFRAVDPNTGQSSASCVPRPGLPHISRSAPRPSLFG